MPQKLQNITKTDCLIDENRTDFEKGREILRSYPVPLAECARMMCSFLFAAYIFICSIRFLFAALVFYLQRTFLFAAFTFCLQRFFFVCSVSFLFAAFLFCLQRFFFVCSVPFLFAAFRFCLRRVPCGPS